MATRGRGRDGRGNPNRPPRFSINRVYEQFKPMSEWRQEDDHDKLLVYLPGFQKEYMKVTTEGSNVVRVRGERLVSENKWSRFQEDYRVPESCDMKGIRAKFDGGILTITMHRKIANAPSPPTATITDRVPLKREEPPREPKEEPKEKKADEPKRVEPPGEPKDDPKEKKPDEPKREEPPRESKKEPKEKKLDVPKREEPRREPKEEPKEKKPDKPQTTRLEDNTLLPQPKPTSSSTPTIQQPSKPTPRAKEAMKVEHDVVEKPSNGEKTDLDKGKGKETILDKETKRDLEVTKGKPSEPGMVSGSLRGIVARRGIMTEDRKLLVNVGVGVLVIAALGVHVSYTIGLIGKGK